MYTVTLIGKGDVLQSGRFSRNAWYNVAFCVTEYGNRSKRIGLKPEMGDRNPMNDNQCYHFNLKGSIWCADSTLFNKKVLSTQSFYVNSSLTIQKSVNVMALYLGTKFIGTDVLFQGQDLTIMSPDVWTNAVPYGPLRTRRTTTFYSRGRVVTQNTVVEMQYASSSSPIYSRTTQRFEFNSDFKQQRSSGSYSVKSFDGIPDTLYVYGTWFDILASRSVVSDCSSFIPDALSPSALRYAFEQKVLDYELKTQNRFVWGDLAQQAANNTRYIDINTSMYFADFLKIKTTLLPFLELLHGEVDLKHLSSAYLATHYGIKLTVKDTLEIADALQRTRRIVDDLPYSVSHSRASETYTMMDSFIGQVIPVLRQYSFKLYYDPIDHFVLNAIRSLYTWDLMPTFQNLWDFIPFSFVIDWFAGVESELERIDHMTYIHTLNVLGCICTTRTTLSVPVESLWFSLSGITYGGTLEITIYDRDLQTIPPQPSHRFDVPTSFNHVIEGAALLIQRSAG